MLLAMLVSLSDASYWAELFLFLFLKIPVFSYLSQSSLPASDSFILFASFLYLQYAVMYQSLFCQKFSLSSQV